MVSVYRCPHGHTWSPAAGSATAVATCPVCGNTADAASDPTARGEPVPVPAVDTPRPFVVGVADPEPDHGDLTSPYLTPTSEDPSFSSLTVLAPGLPADPFGVTRELGPAESPAAEPLTVDLGPPLVPGYVILGEVGRGGMGVVYKARQISLNRTVALKMILAGAHAGAVERERFRREAEAVATLQNPHIVQIFDIGEANGHPYLALEFVDGGSLANQLAGAPWPARAAAELVGVLARAMHYAHEQGVIHRDLKPANVLLAGVKGEGHGARETPASLPSLDSRPSPLTALSPKVTDFGLAKRIDSAITDGATRTGAVMGTPSYIAPEQASGKGHEVGPLADVYSLGAILYDLLTGRPPFRGETPLDTVLQVLHDDPVPPRRLQPTVPRDLETVCLKCLEKHPPGRYPSALALAEDLQRFLADEPIHARPVSAWGRGVKWARRHPALATLGAVTIVATVALVAVLSIAYSRVADAVAQKEAEAAAALAAGKKEQAARKQAEALAEENRQAKVRALTLAEENRRAREQADRQAEEIRQAKELSDRQAEEIRREAERTRRSAYTLRLTQIAPLCERTPRTAQHMLDDEARFPPDLRDFTWAYLRRLCEREERVYAEHGPGDPLYAVAWAPNGTFVVTAGRSGQIRLWDPRTGRTWAVLAGPTDRVHGLAFSPDSEVVAAVGADGRMRLWELPAEIFETARRAMSVFQFVEPIVRPAILSPTVAVDAHRGEATCVAFTPDGRTLASGGADGIVRFWDLTGWRPVGPDAGYVRPGFAAAAGGVALAGAVVASGDIVHNGGRVEELFALPAHNGEVLCMSFAGTGRMLATGGMDRTARVWVSTGDARPWTPESVRTPRTIAGHGEAVRAVALSPDGSVLVTADNDRVPTLKVIHTDTWRERRLTGHTAAVYALAISPDGLLLASGGFDRSVRLWDVEDGRERAVLLGHGQRVSDVAFSPDRRSIVSAGMDGTARVWLTAPRANETADLTKDGTLTAAAAGSGGTSLIVGDERGRVEVFLTALLPPNGRGTTTPPGMLGYWRVPIQLPRRGPGRPAGPIRATAVAPDGRLVFATTEDGVLLWRVFHLRGRVANPGGSLPLPVARPFHLPTPKPVYALAVDPMGKFLAGLTRDGVLLWKLSGVPLTFERTQLNIRAEQIDAVPDARDIAFSPDGKLIAVAVGSGLRVIDRAGNLRGVVEDQAGTAGKVEALAFGHGLVAAADSTGLIRVWRVSPDGHLTYQAELVWHNEAVQTLSFSPNGRTLASGGGLDRSVVLWDPISGQQRAVLTGHTDGIIRVQFTADGSALLSVSRDGVMRWWRARPSTARRPPAGKKPSPRSR